jgi:hypothetical protein
MLTFSRITTPAPPSIRSWLWVVLIVGCLYLPLILGGGIIADDWGDILQSINCNSFWQCYGDWFPLFSNRPLAPLPITLTTRIFTTHYTLYLLTNSAIYLMALSITAKSLSPFISRFSRQIFFILAAAPFIAMPVIVSPINQLTATVAFLYWAISLNALLKFRLSGDRFNYVLAYFFLLCGFLTYEIILPLLFFTGFLPALLQPRNEASKTKSIRDFVKYCIQFIAPILGVLLLIIFWQKVLAPHFIEVFSRLNFNPAHLTRILFTWVHLFLVQIPDLFIRAFAYISIESIGLSTLVGGLFWMSFRHFKNSSSNQISLGRQTNLPFFLISSACLVSSSLIFVLTDESAVSWGYQARGLSSTWFALAIWIACIAKLAQGASKIIREPILLIIFIFTALSILSFTIQRDKYIESWKLQLEILKDLDNLLNAKSISGNASVIYNVPRYTPNNYNRELVFSQSWDLPAALTITSKHRLQSGIVIDSRAKNIQGLRIENGKVMVNDQGQASLENLWLYDFDPTSRTGKLSPIGNSAALEMLITQWKQP